MLKRIAIALLLVLSLSLGGCAASATTGGFNSYVDPVDGYRFLYPIGWVQIKVSNGPDVVFRDLIEETENVSVVISPVPDGKSLEELGSPGEVGYQLSKNAIAPPDSNRRAELVNADSHKSATGVAYYTLEYAVTLPTQNRHNLATVVVNRGKLYTFNASTTERRWNKIKPLLEQVVNSFTVDS